MKKTLLLLLALVMSAGFAFSQTTIAASSKVPGVSVYTNADNGWAGANIILGSDATVWPWSSAGTDGAVAFTPEPGTTYHMKFTVTSSGVTSFRVRWIKDDTNGSNPNTYTAGDAAIVNNNEIKDPDETAVGIPALFTGVIANGETQTLSVDFTMDGSQQADELVGNVAIRGYQGSNDFVVNTIVITDDAGNMLVNYDKDANTVLAPSNSVPGVSVYTNADNGWAGANIIMGNDATVWPWSIAGDDGLVAFTPVEDATYHLTFNVTSSGVTSFRVRWIKDDTNGSNPNTYTAGDAAIVNNNEIKDPNETAVGIPALFTGVIANGETQTLSVDFTMDGSQQADELVGNVAIRGYQGSNDFVINTIVITDDAGNMLVNYEKDASGAGIMLPKITTISAAYGVTGGIVVNANNEKVSVYGIDGRLMKQAIAGYGTTIPMFKGIYVVKVGATNPVKVIVK